MKIALLYNRHESKPIVTVVIMVIVHFKLLGGEYMEKLFV